MILLTSLQIKCAAKFYWPMTDGKYAIQFNDTLPVEPGFELAQFTHVAMNGSMTKPESIAVTANAVHLAFDQNVNVFKGKLIFTGAADVGKFTANASKLYQKQSPEAYEVRQELNLQRSFAGMRHLNTSERFDQLAQMYIENYLYFKNPYKTAVKFAQEFDVQYEDFVIYRVGSLEAFLQLYKDKLLNEKWTHIGVGYTTGLFSVLLMRLNGKYNVLVKDVTGRPVTGMKVSVDNYETVQTNEAGQAFVKGLQKKQVLNADGNMVEIKVNDGTQYSTKTFTAKVNIAKIRVINRVDRPVVGSFQIDSLTKKTNRVGFMQIQAGFGEYPLIYKDVLLGNVVVNETSHDFEQVFVVQTGDESIFTPDNNRTDGDKNKTSDDSDKDKDDDNNKPVVVPTYAALIVNLGTANCPTTQVTVHSGDTLLFDLIKASCQFEFKSETNPALKAGVEVTVKVQTAGYEIKTDTFTMESFTVKTYLLSKQVSKSGNLKNITVQPTYNGLIVQGLNVSVMTNSVRVCQGLTGSDGTFSCLASLENTTTEVVDTKLIYKTVTANVTSLKVYPELTLQETVQTTINVIASPCPRVKLSIRNAAKNVIRTAETSNCIFKFTNKEENATMFVLNSSTTIQLEASGYQMYEKTFKVGMSNSLQATLTSLNKSGNTIYYVVGGIVLASLVAAVIVIVVVKKIRTKNFLGSSRKVSKKAVTDGWGEYK